MVASKVNTEQLPVFRSITIEMDGDTATGILNSLNTLIGTSVTNMLPEEDVQALVELNDSLVDVVYQYQDLHTIEEE